VKYEPFALIRVCNQDVLYNGLIARGEITPITQSVFNSFVMLLHDHENNQINAMHVWAMFYAAGHSGLLPYIGQ
jgi:hypothetical protein